MHRELNDDIKGCEALMIRRQRRKTSFAVDTEQHRQTTILYVVKRHTGRHTGYKSEYMYVIYKYRMIAQRSYAHMASVQSVQFFLCSY